MKVLTEFIPRLNFLEKAEKISGLVDGWNITDSASGRPAPGGAAVACVLKHVYPEKIALPMLIMNYKGAVEIGAAALAAEAMGVDGMIPDPGDAPAYGNLIKMTDDGGTEVLTDDDAILAYRRSLASEPVKDYLRDTVKIEKVKLGCLLTARVPAELAIERLKNGWDFCFFLRLEEESLPKLKEIAEECKKLGKPIYPYFCVGTEKSKKVLDMIGWPATTDMEGAEDFVAGLEGVVDGVIATCLGDAAGDMELLERLQKFRS